MFIYFYIISPCSHTQISHLSLSVYIYSRSHFTFYLLFSISGDMLTLDNTRCQHGREGYEEDSDRHIESAYLDWDDARCKRRRIQEELGISI